MSGALEGRLWKRRGVTAYDHFEVYDSAVQVKHSPSALPHEEQRRETDGQVQHLDSSDGKLQRVDLAFTPCLHVKESQTPMLSHNSHLALLIAIPIPKAN